MDGQTNIQDPEQSSTAMAGKPSKETLRAELRTLVLLAAPIIAERVSHLALGFTDFVFVSRLGTSATAAASPATLSIWTVLCLGMGVVIAVQTFAAQALGRREPREAASYAWAGIWIAVTYGLLTLPLHWVVPAFWRSVGHSPDVQAAESAFCRLALWCVGPAVVCCALEGFFNGIQKPVVVLRSVVVAIVFNAIGDYLLVFGNFGFPRMGIAGAAISTNIAWMIRLVMLLSAFLSDEFAREYGTRRSWRPGIERLRGILRLGAPTGLQWLLDVGSWFLFLVWLMAGFGTATLAASNIAIQFMHISFMPALGVGMAVCSLVGHAVGRREWQLARRRASAGLVLTVAYMCSVGALYAIGRGSLIGLLSSDPEVIRVGAGIMVWAAVFQLFDAVGITYMSALRGAGDTRWPAMLVIFHCWVTFIVGGRLLSWLRPDWGFHGPWMMCTLYIILLGVGLWWRWRRGRWQNIELFRAMAVEAPGLDAVPLAETTY